MRWEAREQELLLAAHKSPRGRQIKKEKRKQLLAQLVLKTFAYAAAGSSIRMRWNFLHEKNDNNEVFSILLPTGFGKSSVEFRGR